MQIKKKLPKKLLSLALILFLCIENFAAIISDNDGSAFITKAEFETMKQDFAKQVNNYNESIDAKIDGAIAAYLAGIKTVTSESSKVLIDNYSDIMWVGDYNVYGKWKKWTSNTAMTSNLTNSWFTPSLNEKRHSFRSAEGIMYSYWTQAWTMLITNWNFVANSGSNGICLSQTSGWAREYEAGVPVLTIRLKKDSYGDYVTEKSFNFFSMSPHAMSTDHGVSATTETSAYAWGNTRWRLTNYELLSKSSGEILKYKVTARNLANSATATYTDTLTPENFPYPCSWCDDDNGTNGDKFDSQVTAYSTEISTSNYFGTGCTWHKLDSRNTQHDFLRRMMLGRTNTQQVNTAYYIKYEGERGRYDFSKSTSYGTWSGKIGNAVTLDRYYTVVSDNMPTNITVDKNCSFSIPHWPTENLRDLTSGMFRYNNQGLKYGEGFPLRIDNQSNGYLHIQFDSSVEGIIGGAKLSTQDLRIDMRKENFLSSTTNWAQGYKGLVNPDSTNEALVTFNDYRYTTSDGKINLTVPMKKDESLWIRIAPWDNTKGYCAKWSNLSMTFNTN